MCYYYVISGAAAAAAATTEGCPGPAYISASTTKYIYIVRAACVMRPNKIRRETTIVHILLNTYAAECSGGFFFFFVSTDVPTAVHVDYTRVYNIITPGERREREKKIIIILLNYNIPSYSRASRRRCRILYRVGRIPRRRRVRIPRAFRINRRFDFVFVGFDGPPKRSSRFSDGRRAGRFYETDPRENESERR